MNKKPFWILFVTCFIGLIFIKIYQQNSTVKVLYKKQKLDREIEALMVEKNNLNIKLNGLKEPSFVYKKVKDSLGLQKIYMNKFRFVSQLEATTTSSVVTNA